MPLNICFYYVFSFEEFESCTGARSWLENNHHLPIGGVRIPRGPPFAKKTTNLPARSLLASDDSCRADLVADDLDLMVVDPDFSDNSRQIGLRAWTAYSTPFGHAFHEHPASHSTNIRPPVP